MGLVVWALLERPVDGDGVGSPVPVSTGGESSAPGPRWLAIGGGSTPESNQVSIEQDLALAADVLGESGGILYAGGRGSHGVQVRDQAPRGDALLAKLGALFSPRGGRDSHYRRTTLPALGPATPGAALPRLRQELGRPGDDPLFVYLAGHGEQGQSASDNLLRLWGQWPLTVRELGAVLDEAPARRRVQVVVTSCFSGGFAELAFRSGDPAAGPALRDRCGLFATTWDLEASGCDPDPDRRRQEGYGIHFLNALRRRDRDGHALAADAVDYDGDGKVSLLEAHTRVRIASAAADIPTTTSERWLRHIGLVRGPESPVALPEEDAVVAALTKQLELQGRLADVPALFAEAQAAVANAQRDLEASRAREDEEFYRFSAAALARWPVIDDPWHPDFAATLSTHRAAIEAFVEDGAPLYAAFLAARAAVDRLDTFVQRLRLRAAPLERLLRAMDTRRLAGRLKARGGAEWDHYLRLLACERAVLR